MLTGKCTGIDHALELLNNGGIIVGVFGGYKMYGQGLITDADMRYKFTVSPRTVNAMLKRGLIRAYDNSRAVLVQE